MAGRMLIVASLLLLGSVAHSATRSRAVLAPPLDVPSIESKALPIVVTTAMPDAHVVGEIRATGGTGNDIEVLLMSEKDWTNYANGHQAQTLYQSGRTTLTSFDVPVPPGSYRLVFSNTFSAFTPKRITGHAELSWTEPDDLPAASALKAKVRPVKLPDPAVTATIPFSTPRGPGQVLVRAAEGLPGSLSVTVRRPQSASTLERVVGTLEAMSIKEAGTIDVDEDGVEDVYLVGESGGSGSATDELVVVATSKLALVSLTITQEFNAGAKPVIAGGTNFTGEKYAEEQSFLQRISEAYLPTASEAVEREDDPKFIFDTWVQDNGEILNGPMTVRRLKGAPADLGSTQVELVDGSVTYQAFFKSGVLAFDHSTNEHYALFHPKSQYAWPTTLKKLGPYLLIGTRGEGLAIVDTRTFSLRRVPLAGAAAEVERIEIVGAKIRINGAVEIDAPSY